MKTKNLKIFTFLLLIFIYSCENKIPQDKEIINPFYEKAFEYREKGNVDSSFSYFYKAKDFFLQQKDSLGAAKCMVNMAIIQEKYGDYFGSQETGISAIHYLNKKDSTNRIYLSINYNTLGIISSKLENYKKAIEFYKQALLFTDNPDDKIIYQNNLANNYRRDNDYPEALEIYKSIINESKKNKIGYARTLTNLALTKWLQNQNYNPIPEFQHALKIRSKEHDNWGLNSSYAHFADYYTNKQPDSALTYARKMYDISKKLKSPDDKAEALQKLISLETPKNSKQYFNIYQKLNDSLQTSRNKAKNQFALIRYETEKNKADFLKAKAESTQKQTKIFVRNIILTALIIFIIFVYFYYQRRQKRLQQEKLLEVKNTELKYSKKVHDRVANRIYQLLSQVENTDKIDKESLLFGLENVYEISRDISYDNKDISENQAFSEQLHHMLNSYSSNAVKIIFNGNNENLWQDVNFQSKMEIYLVLQELMTNMKKHSRASIVSLKFSKENSVINISYTDNGTGIKKHSPKNGLQNMENRMNAIKGTIIFDTETNNLLKINISFPV
ncbi:tetratricopeptide repeat-containing sensor histidine kinase [Epilithonimonas mollis]|uniref:Tetratricopeptide repeat-containing protein n=1 Tax=Epilithonimonas mollis TaxID=216903 RepID=A0A1M6NKY1_9FLAO|nr:tetratricopeptide repeat-containing sensor histidine kinase [Epilithonimonas mollis]SHJ96172.1 Tetratricopeptide repeat-containing protein [Epilithonimonas mollis]